MKKLAKRSIALLTAVLMVFGTFSTALAEAVTGVQSEEAIVLLFDGASVSLGGELKLEYELSVAETPLGYKIEWRIEGNKSQSTAIADGILHVDFGETASYLTISAAVYARVVDVVYLPVVPDDTEPDMPDDDDDYDVGYDDDGYDDDNYDDGYDNDYTDGYYNAYDYNDYGDTNVSYDAYDNGYDDVAVLGAYYDADTDGDEYNAPPAFLRQEIVRYVRIAFAEATVYVYSFFMPLSASVGSGLVWSLANATATDTSDEHNDITVPLSTWGGGTALALNETTGALTVSGRAGTSDGGVFTFAQAGMDVTQNTYSITVAGVIVRAEGSVRNPNFRIHGITGGATAALGGRFENNTLTNNMTFNHQFTVGVEGTLASTLTGLRFMTNAAGDTYDLIISTLSVWRLPEPVWSLSNATAADTSDEHNDTTVPLSTWGGGTALALNETTGALTVSGRAGTSDGGVFTFAEAGMDVTQNTYTVTVAGAIVRAEGSVRNPNFRIHGITGGATAALGGRFENNTLTNNMTFNHQFTVGVEGTLASTLTGLRFMTNAAGDTYDLIISTLTVYTAGEALPQTPEQAADVAETVLENPVLLGSLTNDNAADSILNAVNAAIAAHIDADWATPGATIPAGIIPGDTIPTPNPTITPAQVGVPGSILGVIVFTENPTAYLLVDLEIPALPDAAPVTSFAWTYADGTRLGAETGNALGAIRFEIPQNLRVNFSEATGAELVFAFSPNLANRRVIAWTNVSNAQPTDLAALPTGSFADTSAVIAGAAANDVAATRFAVPMAFLTDGATHIYVAKTTNNPAMNEPGNHRPAELNRIATMTMELTVPLLEEYSWAYADGTRFGAASGNALGAIRFEIPQGLRSNFENVESTELSFTFSAATGNRRVIAWTNVSMAQPENLATIPTGNIAAITNADPRVIAGVGANAVTEASFALPLCFLTDATTHLYVAMTTTNDNMNLDTNHRPAELATIANMTLSLSMAPSLIFPDGTIYDIDYDTTLGDLPGNVGDHIILRAPVGGTLSGVNETSISLTGRDSNAQGIDICVVKLHSLLTPDHRYRFEIAGTVGTAPATSANAARFIRPSGGGGDTLTHINSSTGENGAFSWDVTLYYETIADHAVNGAAIYRIGTNNAATNDQDIVITTLRITELAPPEPPPVFGYIFDLQDHLAGIAPGTVIARSAAAEPPAINNDEHIRVSHAGTGAADAITITVGQNGLFRNLNVNRGGANATRGLLLVGVDFQEGDIITIVGDLLTPGLDIRLQPMPSTTMPSFDEHIQTGDGPFTLEYTVTEAFADGSTDGVRILAHGAGIAATFVLYDLTVYRPDPDAVPFTPGPQIIRTVAVEFEATNVTEPTPVTVASSQLRRNTGSAGNVSPANMSFNVPANGTVLWTMELPVHAYGFIGWQNMGEITPPDGIGLEATAFIINGIRLIPTSTFDMAERNLPSRFQRASEDIGHVYATCSCGNASLELATVTYTIPGTDAEGGLVTGNDAGAYYVPTRVVVAFIQNEDLDGCHIPFTWGQPGGPALHLETATDETTFRGSDATVVHTGGSANNDPHVLRLSRIAITDDDREAMRNALNSELMLNTVERGNRAIWVWTDLSANVQGASGNPAQLSFLTNANHTAGALVREVVDGPTLIEIPMELLYIPPASPGGRGIYAEHIYIMTTLSAHAGASDIEGVLVPGGLRRDSTNEISHATLTFVAPRDFVRNISLNIGVNESEMRFTWWTPIGQALPQSATIQVARQDQLVDGQMPENARTIRATQPWHGPAAIGSAAAHMGAPHPVPNITPIDLTANPQYAFDTNRLSVPGLTAATRYVYRVGNRILGDNGQPEYVWSDIHHFDTFDLTDGQTVLLIGDPQIGGQSIPRMTRNWPYALTRAVDRANIHGGPGFILNVADNWSAANIVYRMEIYLSPAELRNIPVFTTIGNHDTVTQRTGAGYESPFALQSYIYYHPNHTWLECRATGVLGHSRHTSNYQRGGGNHFFSYGDVLYISLNTNDREQREIHRATLEAAVASHPDATWRVVIFHQDPFGSGTGHAAGMPASSRQRINHLLQEFDIDIVFNGHEHTHGRSHFIDSPTLEGSPVNVMEQRPSDFGRNRDGRLVFDANPGVFVAPQGIPYITLGTIADFPKYTSIQDPMLPWVAWTDPAQFDYYAQYSILLIDGDSLTVNTYVIPHAHGTPGANATLNPTGEPSFRSNSFTIRQNARFDDLELLIAGANAFEQGDMTDASWADFRAAVTAAQALTAASPATAIHDAFMHIYDMYFALENSADFTALRALVEEASALLDTAVEGPWYGQFPRGSIAEFRAVYAPAALVNSIRLSTQVAIDAQYALLRPAFDAFVASASDIPRPWIDVHNIPATGEYTLGLLNWMDDYVPLQICYTCSDPDAEFPTYCRFIVNWEKHPNVTPRFHAHFTKTNFAGGSLRLNPHPAAGDNHHTNFVVERDSVRPCEPFGPANAVGGRHNIPFGTYTDGSARFTNGHITQTHAGEWIRYELNVAQAGEYRLRLGAVNPQAVAKTVLVRDSLYNTLTYFNIPAGHGVQEGWTAANPLIEAEDTIFLPQGRFILEILFMTDGTAATGPTHHGTGNVSSYPDGANVDILTLERIGSMERPTPAPICLEGIPNVVEGSTTFILPLMPNDAAGNSLRQRGWAMAGTSNEWGVVTDNPFTLNEVSAVTHLIFDVAGRPAGNMNIVLAGGHTGGWNQDDLSVAAGFCQETMRIIIDLRNHTAYALWNDVSDGGARRVIVSHNSESWDEMNVIRAFFVLDDSYVPPPPGCGDCDEPDCEYCNPPEITTEVIWTLEVTQEMVDTLNANETYDRVTPADSPTFTYVNGNLQVSGRAENWFSLDVLLRDMELTEDGSYRITAVGTAAPGALFMAEKPLENEPWNVGRITGNATGVIKYFTSVIPRVGTVTPGYDEDGLCLHRIRIFTTGTGNFTVSSIIVERMLGVVVPPPDVCEECGDDPCTCPPDDYTPAPTPPPTLQPAPRPPAGGGFAPVVRPAAPGAITPPAAPPAQPPAAAVSVDYEGVEVVIPDNVMAYLFPNVADLANMQVRITQTPGAFGTDYDTTGVLTTVDVAIYLHDTPITRRLPSPVAVAVSLEGFDLAGVNVHRIVALDESGEVIGGHVCTDTNRFIFATALTGAFEITYVQELRRLVVGLDTNIIRDLADNAPLQTMDVLPVIENGRTLLPVRFLANALGAEIGWNEAAREVTLTKDGQSLTIPIGVITPELAALGLDVPPMIVDGRTMMPTRFIANYFGALIEWDDATRTFEIIM